MYASVNPAFVEVKRPISGMSELSIGQIVDASGFRSTNLAGLIRNRYLAPVYAAPTKKEVAASQEPVEPVEPGTLADDLTP